VSAPLDDDLRYSLATVFAEYRPSDFWTTKLTAGLYDQVYNSFQPFNPNPIPDSYSTDATKHAVYWDNTLRWNDDHTTVLGAVYENSDFWYYSYWNNTWGLPPVTTDARERDQYGFYVNHIWDVTEDWNLTGGVRWEDYDPAPARVSGRRPSSSSTASAVRLPIPHSQPSRHSAGTPVSSRRSATAPTVLCSPTSRTGSVMPSFTTS
jgi:outer membrane receptor protein involved in Fe transport